jgi:hypothetical protein
MTRFQTIPTLILLALTSLAAHAAGPLANPLAGTWALVAVDNVSPDGSRVQIYGPNPQGIAIFDSAGHYAMEIFRVGRPKFASNDKSRGTPDEYQAAVQGSNSHFGTYSVNAADHTVTFNVDQASFPNWEGTARTSPYSLTNDELKIIVAHPTTGGPNVTGEVVWKRMR